MTKIMDRVENKSNEELRLEWNRIAAWRHEQLINGCDISYLYVLLPATLKMQKDCNLRAVLDVGCGTGFFINKIADRCERLVGVDISDGSIEVAKSYCISKNNVNFINSSIEEYARTIAQPYFTTCFANMTLMDCIHLEEVLKSIFHILKPGGVIICSITHPCFWPAYWGYSLADWFDYWSETPVEAAFVTSNAKSKYVTTHIHRPLSAYFTAFKSTGFKLDLIDEPMPSVETKHKYKEQWKYPRFIVFRFVKPD